MNNDKFPNYAREIEKHWKVKERQRKTYKFTSPQLNLRNDLIKWLKSVSVKLKISYRTMHLATYILDMFMDRHSITKDRLGFVALVCLMLAAKFEELDCKIPTISELNTFDGNRYSNRDFVKVEVMILKFLDFGLTEPTTAHFAEYYVTRSVLPNELRVDLVSFQQLQEVASKLIIGFLDVSLEDVAFLYYYPSQVAAACILAMRRCLNLSPPWTSALVELTGYFEADLAQLVTVLDRKFKEESVKKNKPVNSPDHGYISDTT